MAIINPDMLLNPFEPIQKSRFVVTVDGIPSFLVKSFNIPQPSTTKIVVDGIHDQAKHAGKTTYGDMSMTLYQAVDPSTLQMIYSWHRLQFEAETGKKGYTEMYKKNMQIDILAPDGATVQRHKIIGAWIMEIGGLDYDKSADDKVDITLTLSIDKPILEF